MVAFKCRFFCEYVMPEPKISSIMNNCLLHSMTPELVGVVKEIANGHIEITEAYEKLKQTFVEFYELNAGFTWQDFSILLSTYNLFDIQIIFGPVLREYMRKNLEICNLVLLDSVSIEAFNDEFLSILENGRFGILDPLAAYELAGKHLKLGFLINKFGDHFYGSEDLLPQHIIKLNHVGDDDHSYHFERSIVENIDYSQSPDSKLSFITKHPLQDKEDTLSFISLIKQHIHATLAGPDILKDACAKIKVQLEYIEKFNNLLVQMIAEGIEHPNLIAHYRLSNLGHNQELLSERVIRQQMILDLKSIIYQKIDERYSFYDASRVQTIANNFIDQLEYEFLNAPDDLSIEQIKDLFIKKLKDFNQQTIEYKGILEIIFSAIVHFFKVIFGISDRSFSLTKCFFESDRPENCLPSNLTYSR